MMTNDMENIGWATIGSRDITLSGFNISIHQSNPMPTLEASAL